MRIKMPANLAANPARPGINGSQANGQPNKLAADLKRINKRNARKPNKCNMRSKLARINAAAASR